MTVPTPRARPTDLDVRIGRLEPGPTDSIVDVADVRVGHATVWRDEPAPPDGRGVARTGVTAIVPFGGEDLFHHRVPAGAAVLNGAGEAIGITTISEWGVLESPILLTSSMAIGRVYDAAITALVGLDGRWDEDEAIMPVVAECDDGWLNTAYPIQVDIVDVASAISGAVGPEAGPVAGGAVGAGTGMVSFELKGGIGSASRVARPADRRRTFGEPGTATAGPAYTVGALVLANFGRIGWLTIDGVRVGDALLEEGWFGDATREREHGSCVVVVATDAPMHGAQLERMARRAGLGLARTGSFAGHGSGDIFLAFSTGSRVRRESGSAIQTLEVLDDEQLDPFFAAVSESTEAAVIDALFRADTVEGRAGHVARALPIERTLDLLRSAGRIRSRAGA